MQHELLPTTGHCKCIDSSNTQLGSQHASSITMLKHWNSKNSSFESPSKSDYSICTKEIWINYFYSQLKVTSYDEYKDLLFETYPFPLTLSIMLQLLLLKEKYNYMLNKTNWVCSAIIYIIQRCIRSLRLYIQLAVSRDFARA